MAGDVTGENFFFFNTCCCQILFFKRVFSSAPGQTSMLTRLAVFGTPLQMNGECCADVAISLFSATGDEPAADENTRLTTDNPFYFRIFVT